MGDERIESRTVVTPDRTIRTTTAGVTFASSLDVAAMVAVLEQAARDGTPLCEECQQEAEAAADAQTR